MPASQLRLVFSGGDLRALADPSFRCHYWSPVHIPGEDLRWVVIASFVEIWSQTVPSKKTSCQEKDVLLVEISVKVNCLMRSYHGKAPEGDDYASREGCGQPTHTTTAVPQVTKSWFRPSCIWKNLFSLLESFLYKILVLLLSDTFYRKFMGMSWFPISACTANLLLSGGVFGVMSKLALLLLQWGWTVWYQKQLAQYGRTL